ncbi:HupE/UreJ family protein [Candidatus Binatia bacterium]|nr:HupE/UreJ family protein [Candidatus Binatia bacterium]
MQAHPLAPSLLELRESGGGRFAVRWKTSAFRPTGAHLAPILPDWCTNLGDETSTADPAAIERRFTIDCGERGLHGATLGVRDLDVSRTLALVRVELADGGLVRELLDGARSSMVVPERQSRLDVARQYLELGIEHLLTGIDHLLFVLCLCLLVRERRTLAWTITAFTVGHSVTLTLATLGVVHFPQSVAETAIALSIVLLAAELLRDDDAPAATPPPASWIRRRPWAMAFTFGMLHGLGFAGALSEVGLPASEIPLALLTFNVGIELGQLAFVLAVLLVARLARPLLATLPPRAVRLPAWAIGCVAAFWFWSRAGLVVQQLLQRS